MYWRTDTFVSDCIVYIMYLEDFGTRLVRMLYMDLINWVIGKTANTTTGRTMEEWSGNPRVGGGSDSVILVDGAPLLGIVRPVGESL